MGGHGANLGVEGGKHGGNVHDKAAAVLGGDGQGGNIAVGNDAGPAYIHPAAVVLALAEQLLAVGAVTPVDGYALAAGDKACNLVTGDGGTATGELDKAVGKPLHQYAVDGLGFLLGLNLPSLGGFADLVQRGALVGLLVFDFVLESVCNSCGGDTTVTYSGKVILGIGQTQTLENGAEHALLHGLVKADGVVLEFAFKHFTAADNIFFPAFLLEPLLYLGAGRAALGHIQPVAAGAGSRLGGAYLYNVAVFQRIVVGYDASVDLGAHHAVADVGVDGICKVYGGCAGGQVNNVTLGREDENLVGEHVYLKVVEEVLCVGLLLAFKESAYPCKLVLVAGAHQLCAVCTHLVLPVGGNAVLGGVVHVPCAYLHLKGDTL